jgi:hypothetical protein
LKQFGLNLMNIEYSKACLMCYNESPTFVIFSFLRDLKYLQKNITNTIIIQTLYILVQYVMTKKMNNFYHYKNHGILMHHIL